MSITRLTQHSSDVSALSRNCPPAARTVYRALLVASVAERDMLMYVPLFVQTFEHQMRDIGTGDFRAPRRHFARARAVAPVPRIVG